MICLPILMRVLRLMRRSIHFPSPSDVFFCGKYVVPFYDRPFRAWDTSGLLLVVNPFHAPSRDMGPPVPTLARKAQPCGSVCAVLSIRVVQAYLPRDRPPERNSLVFYRCIFSFFFFFLCEVLSFFRSSTFEQPFLLKWTPIPRVVRDLCMYRLGVCDILYRLIPAATMPGSFLFYTNSSKQRLIPTHTASFPTAMEALSLFPPHFWHFPPVVFSSLPPEASPCQLVPTAFGFDPSSLLFDERGFPRERFPFLPNPLGSHWYFSIPFVDRRRI